VAHAVRAPRGAPPFGTALQTPSAPVTLQASHCPVQLVSQQTPSMQLPFWQSEPRTQAAPLVCFSTHLLAMQYCVAVQAEQSPSHAPTVQTPGAQSTELPVAHRPPPSQLPSGVASEPVQIADPQEVLESGKLQAKRLVPPHEPAHEPAPPQSGRAPTG